jgi:hypothetical protein
MIVSRKHKFIYLGINKTGTISIEKALWSYRNKYYHKYLEFKHNIIHKGKPAFKHNPALNIKALIGDRAWNEYFSFTFVRNPWARTLSEYAKHRHNENIPLKQGFTEWVLAGGNWLARENTMKKFVTDENGEIIVDYIGKLENLHEDMKIICAKIGIEPVKLQHFHKTKNTAGYREMYTEETRRIVTEWVSEDAEMFGYKF